MLLEERRVPGLHLQILCPDAGPPQNVVEGTSMVIGLYTKRD